MEFMSNPKHKLMLGSTEYECELLKTAKVIKNENGFDIATIELDDTDIYPGVVTAGTAVQLEVTNEGKPYPSNPMFKGVVRFPVIDLAPESNTLTLACDGAGYGLGKMFVRTEYGTQSIHPDNDTITEIISGANHGIVAKYVNKVLDNPGINSGYNYTTTLVDTITNVINYIEFPYKPADKCFNDLVDLVTALRAGAVGPHWIVTTDNKIHLKLVNGTQASWTKYYGNSLENATLEYGEDYETANFEKVGPEANYIVYYGLWRRPSNGDGVTENTANLWLRMDLDSTVSNDSSNKIINEWSVKCLRNNAVGSITGMWYPTGRNAAWNFFGFSDLNVPTLNFYVRRHCPGAWSNFYVYLETALGGGLYGYGYTDLTSDVSENDKWYHFSLPVGPYYNASERFANFKWYGDGNLLWAKVDAIRFRWQCNQNDYVNVDGLYFGDAHICRVASNSSISPYSMKLITDDIGKDDSLKEGDDSGLMAKLAYSELLRQQKTCYLGYVTCDMLPEALPGQWFYVQADMRSSKITQEIKANSYKSTIYLTDDVINGRARMRYEDINKVYADMRPEFQDRQATSIKAGKVDWRIARLAKNYT